MYNLMYVNYSNDYNFAISRDNLKNSSFLITNIDKMNNFC
jgi:hypothetical protein